MFCNFCAATIFVSIARAEQNVESQLQFYLNLRKHVASFDHILHEKLEKLEVEITEDLLKKLSVLLVFDFEAACRLKDWDGLGDIISKAGICKSMRVYELMADCILSCEAPTQGSFFSLHCVLPFLSVPLAAFSLTVSDISLGNLPPRPLLPYILTYLSS